VRPFIKKVIYIYASATLPSDEIYCDEINKSVFRNSCLDMVLSRLLYLVYPVTLVSRIHTSKVLREVLSVGWEEVADGIGVSINWNGSDAK